MQHRLRPLSCSSSSRPAPSPTTIPRIASLAEVQSAAEKRGLTITLTELGPFYRVVCRRGPRRPSKEEEDGKERGVLGVSEGFVAPWFGLMHCDTLQIFTRGARGEEGEKTRGGVLGLGLLLGGAVFAHGLEKGCKKAEILAINDDDSWHERLVRYYSYFGFKRVRKVGGNGLSDLPHLLVWGGEGERMDADIEQTLERWTPAILGDSSQMLPMQGNSKGEG